MKINNILIIEDERPNATRLKRLLLKINPAFNILGIEETVDDSVKWLSSHPSPHIIMMDIRLADGLCFEIFNRTEIKCPVIFTTAYDEYAVRAFKYNSIDYLLKPIEEEELEAALLKLENYIQSVTSMNSAIEGLLNYFHPSKYRERFLIPQGSDYRILQVKDIRYFHTDLGINRAYLADNSFEVVPQTLEELGSQLDPKYFFRANRQFILHVESIKQIHNHFNGKLKVELKQNKKLEIMVSREKAQALKNWLDF